MLQMLRAGTLLHVIDTADAESRYSVTYDGEHQHEHTIVAITRRLHSAGPSTPRPTHRG